MHTITEVFLEEESENLKGAIEDFSRVIELNPEYADAYYNRGIVNENLKNYTNAVADFDEAIKLEPSDKAYREARQQAQQKLDNS